MIIPIYKEKEKFCFEMKFVHLVQVFSGTMRTAETFFRLKKFELNLKKYTFGVN